ncbi:hypothetical protein V1478_007704 [Vespula squamosa]|uniref:Uncharacterized protein n=1 Tax=Vespula squamosa TaxID=30214 RepID=A0ABD2AXB8_VESSQ
MDRTELIRTNGSYLYIESYVTGLRIEKSKLIRTIAEMKEIRITVQFHIFINGLKPFNSSKS